MASVFTRKDGRVVVKWFDGIQYKHEYFGRGKIAQARAERRWRDLEVDKKLAGVKTADTGPPFRELAAFYTSAKQGDSALTSRLAQFYKLEGIILPRIGDLPANQITPAVIDRYKNRRLKDIKNPVAVARKEPPKYIRLNTIHREITDIITILNWAVARGYITTSPLAGYKKPKKRDEVIEPPTIKECRAILNNAAPHLKRALSLSYYTGLRPGVAELLRLKWSAVNLQKGTITVTSARKGGPVKRVVPLPLDIVNTLMKWKEEDGCEYIIHFKGKPVQRLKTAWNRAKERAGVTRRLRLYDLRHAFVTSILAAGGDLKSVSQMIGHSRPDTTLRVYQHIDMELQRRTANLLPSLADTIDTTGKIVSMKKFKRKSAR